MNEIINSVKTTSLLSLARLVHAV